MTRITAILLIIVTLGIAAPLQAQSDSQPPYLYYYSRLLGGLIIERADGTDSRQIAADIIPPNMSGLAGPGWSPSGKYFAARGVNYGDYNGSTQGVFLIDTKGNTVIDTMSRDITAYKMEWSPSGEDQVLIAGNTVGAARSNHALSYWLIDAQARKVLAEYSDNFELWPYESTAAIWETEPKQIHFYVAPKAFSEGQYFQITMRFDGTVLKQPTTKAEFETYFTDPILRDASTDDIGDNQSISPSGRYQTSGWHPAILHDLYTAKDIELPTHSQGFYCQLIEWTTDEHYLITLYGIGRSDGCGSAVMGITTQNGTLWRELGGCSWESPCVGWLPLHINISDLPPGQPKPIQLDSVAYQSEKTLYGPDYIQNARLRCENDSFKIVFDQEPDKVLFQLPNDVDCPYKNIPSNKKSGIPVVFAYDPHNKLLATYLGNEQPVSIWSMQKDIGQRILKLNTYGYELQFTADRKYLRARNVNGWKIYSVADILAAATTPK